MEYEYGFWSMLLCLWGYALLIFTLTFALARKYFINKFIKELAYHFRKYLIAVNNINEFIIHDVSSNKHTITISTQGQVILNIIDNLNIRDEFDMVMDKEYGIKREKIQANFLLDGYETMYSTVIILSQPTTIVDEKCAMELFQGFYHKKLK